MDHVTRITKDGTPYAMVFRGRMPVNGVEFLTTPEQELQLGVMQRPAGYEVQPHTHPPFERTARGTSEFLYVQEGKVEVEVYDEDWVTLGTETVEGGDFLLLFRGGHRLKMLEPTRMIEVKQGPYPGEGAKEFRS
jgi:mannose-6-phosphate isomerase-like protein (cupin superfamily)